MIEIIGLSKRYKANDVLDRLDLCLEKDQVYCLLGKNGVGKTTLLNLVLDLARPTFSSNKGFLLNAWMEWYIGAFIRH